MTSFSSFGNHPRVLRAAVAATAICALSWPAAASSSATDTSPLQPHSSDAPPPTWGESQTFKSGLTVTVFKPELFQPSDTAAYHSPGGLRSEMEGHGEKWHS